jgi:hypothetical protein
MGPLEVTPFELEICPPLLDPGLPHPHKVQWANSTPMTATRNLGLHGTIPLLYQSASCPSIRSSCGRLVRGYLLTHWGITIGTPFGYPLLVD